MIVKSAAVTVSARLAVVIISLSLTGCLAIYPTDAFEALCTKKRLSAEQAAAINALKDKKTPGYCAGQTGTGKDGTKFEGQVHCDAEEYDRVLAAHCAFAPKILKTGD